MKGIGLALWPLGVHLAVVLPHTVVADGFHEWSESAEHGKVTRISSGALMTLNMELEPVRNGNAHNQKMSMEEWFKSAKNIDCLEDGKHMVCVELEQDKEPTTRTPPVLAQKSSKAACLSYEPSVVELTGILIRRTFPGPPNYESVHRGDSPEVYWLIDLSRPVCVHEGKTNPDLNPARKDIRRVQLVILDPTIYETKKELIGKRVVARGALFGEHTRHHHTRVLLTTSTLTKAE